MRLLASASSARVEEGIIGRDATPVHLRAKPDRRRLREQIESLRAAVEDRDEQLRELRQSTKHTSLLEVETAKEEYYNEVLRLRKLLAKGGPTRNADMWDDGYGKLDDARGRAGFLGARRGVASTKNELYFSGRYPRRPRTRTTTTWA